MKILKAKVGRNADTSAVEYGQFEVEITVDGAAVTEMVVLVGADMPDPTDAAAVKAAVKAKAEAIETAMNAATGVTVASDETLQGDLP